MPQSDMIAQSILQALDVVVLRRVGEREYELFGKVPEYYLRLFPPSAGRPCAAPWGTSEALRFFLGDAETFFAGNTSGFLPSGVWMEEGSGAGVVPLTATAMCLGPERVIVLRRLSHEIVEKQRQNSGAPATAQVEAPPAPTEEALVMDALTSLYSGESFVRLLQNETARSAGELSLLLVDVDGLKAINTIHGSQVGDTVLASLGALLHNQLRRGDISARYKGGTFGIMALDTQGYQTIRLAEKLRLAVEDHTSAKLPPITVCIGGSAHRKGESSEALLERAEAALDEARTSGKNRVRVK
ncbi:GGDEF domain-containing protein [Desulfovibrio sp. OttesenSCG-928-G15]|nr:GGDEF domain-containing protein [Desulfovibrio sp. OttesenSCG-928-G15]